jgi:hypothetical protein
MATENVFSGVQTSLFYKAEYTVCDREVLKNVIEIPH